VTGRSSGALLVDRLVARSQKIPYTSPQKQLRKIKGIVKRFSLQLAVRAPRNEVRRSA
jgi:hypothetical protein